MKKSSNSVLKSIGKVLLVIVIVIVYAFGLQVTKVDLEKPQEAKRQEQLTNILQGLAHPDLFTYESDRINTEAKILVPCVGEAPENPPVSTTGPTINLSSTCAEGGDKITVNGSGFEPGEDVFIFFVPYSASADSEVELKLANQKVVADNDGNFSEEVTLKKDRLSENLQTVRAAVNRKHGGPHASEALVQTGEKILETVFLAFIATTLGVVLAVPISFLAARNLMLEVTSTFTKFMASLLVMPVGGYLGYLVIAYLDRVGGDLVSGSVGNPEALWWGVLPLVGLASVQAASADSRKSMFAAIRRVLTIAVIVVVVVVGLSALGHVGRVSGLSLKKSLGSWSFIGNFILIISDVIVLGLPALGVLVGALMLNPIVNKVLDPIIPRLSKTGNKIVASVLAVFAGAIFFALIAAIINWFYEFGDLPQVLVAPAVTGAIIFFALSMILDPSQEIPMGMFVYYTFRTIMNVFRSIEPLVMVVAFAVWVGIGPFAGVMALGLHTIVALGKLYSEQVENISTGPIEAITATGANRLQTIIYAVIPQIVPPYIAFTLYRWDINVRMSTIIGFGGGGGIGFLLSQNINLLKYRQASVNMLAIAIVVISLDYISAKVREKIV